jgi:polygalacturonase
VISNCVFIGTDRGIRIKSRRGRGGIIEDIRVSNLIMDGVLCPFTMNLYYHIGMRGDLNVSDKNPRSINDGTPRLRRIYFSHITAREVKHAAGFLYGLAEMPLEDISFSDISISISDEADSGYPEMADDIPSMSQAGFFIRNARRIRLENIQVTGQVGKAFDMDESVEAVIIP